LLREIKEDPATRDLPVYVITVVDNRDKALALGADGFHAKPVDRIWLLNQLEALLAPEVRKLVLLIDDDAASRYLIKNLLSKSECELLEASGGVDGIRLAKESQPALVVLDLTMDGMDGFDVLAALHDDAETSDIPVVVHTSKSLTEEDYSRLSGALDIIPKSIMASRDVAESRFSQALQKAGLIYVGRTSNQPMVAE
jgi:CheY-like chemotaxis protein